MNQPFASNNPIIFAWEWRSLDRLHCLLGVEGDMADGGTGVVALGSVVTSDAVDHWLLLLLILVGRVELWCVAMSSVNIDGDVTICAGTWIKDGLVSVWLKLVVDETGIKLTVKHGTKIVKDYIRTKSCRWST